MRIHFIVHEAFEAPGVYYDWAIKRGHDVTMTKLYQGKKLPKFLQLVKVAHDKLSNIVINTMLSNAI